jgi:hypothetical protein
MLVHDDIFAWEGFGGKFNLASGKCRIRIIDLTKGTNGGVSHLKPIIVVATDLPDDASPVKVVTVRSCAGHIATSIVRKFKIDRQRMLFVEYYPRRTYGGQRQHVIPEKFDAVDFQWHDDRALFPKWRPLKPPILETVRKLVSQSDKPA